MKKYKIIIPEFGEINADGMVINLLASYAHEAAKSYENKGYKKIALQAEDVFQEMYGQLKAKGYFPFNDEEKAGN